MEEGGAPKRTVLLSPEGSQYVDRLVEAGAFASDSEVVEAGLQALRDRVSTIEQWLTDDVAPVYDLMQADPSRGIPAADVRERLRARQLGHSENDKQ